MTREFHPLVRRLLDGEISLGDLPPELREEGRQALHLLTALDRGPVTLPASLDERVMAEVRRRARSPGRRAWRWLVRSREVRVRLSVRPWVAGALAAAAVAVFVIRPGHEATSRSGLATAYVRFVFYAPGAHRVAVVGSFNQWNPDAAPLASTGTPGVWTTTIPLPLGQYQYAFLVDGERWAIDPVAPAVEDGFGRRNSVVAVLAEDGGGRAL